MKKFKPKRTIVSIDLLSLDLLVQRGGDVNDCIKEYCRLNKLDIWTTEPSRSRRGNFIYHTDMSNGAIWLHEESSFGVVTHEVFHAAHHLLKKYGFQLGDESEEMYAYFMQYVVNEIMLKLYGWKRP